MFNQNHFTSRDKLAGLPFLNKICNMVVYPKNYWLFGYYSMIVLGVITLLVGCSNSTETIEVKWDRDNCENCRMVLSDRHFAVQVRGGPKNKVYLFDDVGCAVHWLHNQAWDKRPKIWVADYRNGHWLDAYTAYYVSGQITPMNFGLGALAKSVSSSMNFETAKAQILLKKHQHVLK